MMNKEKLKEALKENPKYDSGWIDSAVDISTKYPNFKCLNAENLEKLSAEKLSRIAQFLDKNAPSVSPLNVDSSERESHIEKIREFLEIITDPVFNISQMELLIAAFANNLTINEIKSLANPDINFTKLNYIANGMVEGKFNMFDIVDVLAFNNEQIYELYAGLMLKIDIDVYKDPKFTAEQMGIIRHAMQHAAVFDGIKVSKEDNGSINITITGTNED